MRQIINHLPVRRRTQNDGHYFFGYYDKYPWDKSQRYLLAHKSEFMNRQPVGGDTAVIGMIDLSDNDRFIELADTSAWCWQQGSMLQWLPDSSTRIIYNDVEDGEFVARILDVVDGKTETLCRPIYCLSPDGRYALSANFARLDKERPGYGYAGVPDKFAGQPHSDQDGIWLIDLKQNSAELVISLDQIVKMRNNKVMQNAPNWFNHLLFSPDGKRFIFIHRWRGGNGRFVTHLYTANRDGSGIYPLNLDGLSSHFSWIDNNRIICYCHTQEAGFHYHEFTDRTPRFKIIGEDFFADPEGRRDGHCSYSNDLRWMLTDTYPIYNQKRALLLVDLLDDLAYEIGQFYSPPDLIGPIRCDLHPNWSRDCKTVCIDSLHEGFRAIYTLDVESLTS